MNLLTLVPNQNGMRTIIGTSWTLVLNENGMRTMHAPWIELQVILILV